MAIVDDKIPKFPTQLVELDLRNGAAGSKVLLSGVDISGALRGVDLTCHVGSVTEVTLNVSSPVLARCEAMVTKVLDGVRTDRDRLLNLKDELQGLLNNWGLHSEEQWLTRLRALIDEA